MAVGKGVVLSRKVVSLYKLKLMILYVKIARLHFRFHTCNTISVFVQTGEHTSLRLLINFCQYQHSCKFRYGNCILLSSCNVHASLIAYDMPLLLLRGLKQFVAHQNVLV